LILRGTSEKYVGEFIASDGDRDRFVLATKNTPNIMRSKRWWKPSQEYDSIFGRDQTQTT